MVFCGLFPTEADRFPDLREALGKLQLNDAALVYEPEVRAHVPVAPGRAGAAPGKARRGPHMRGRPAGRRVLGMCDVLLLGLRSRLLDTL